MTVVNVNPLYTPRELEHQLKDSGAEAIVILENFATTLQAVVAQHAGQAVVVATMGDLLGPQGRLVNFVVRRVKKLVPAWSLPGHVKFQRALKGAGSTLQAGRGRGRRHRLPAIYRRHDRHRPRARCCCTATCWPMSRRTRCGWRTPTSNKPKPAHLTFICALPLYHIFALTVNALMGMQQGAHNILIPNPRDIPGFVKELGKHRSTSFPASTRCSTRCSTIEDFRKLDFKPLLLTLGGGMAVQQRGRRALEGADRLQHHRRLRAVGNLAGGDRQPAQRRRIHRHDRPAAARRPRSPSATTTATPCALGEVGEICIRGPQVMAGYWNRPDETAKVMTADGFFKSGDMGFMDERGYTKIVDRKKDMILVSGFNVYPNELEDVVARHPGVLEVAAIGVPDEHSGEVPKLFVVKKDPTLTEEELMAYCKREPHRLQAAASYIEFRTELPKTQCRQDPAAGAASYAAGSAFLPHR